MSEQVSDWQYTDEGYVQCPECYESMPAAHVRDLDEHSPGCKIGLLLWLLEQLPTSPEGEA